MNKKIQEKITRFIELSKKFSKSQNDLFKKDGSTGDVITLDLNSLSISGTSCSSYVSNCYVEGRELYIDKNNVVKAVDNKPLTNAEKIMAEASIKAKLSDEFDEYKSLQYDLEQYFKITNKLTTTNE